MTAIIPVTTLVLGSGWCGDVAARRGHGSGPHCCLGRATARVRIAAWVFGAGLGRESCLGQVKELGVHTD
jgi:hypothetical protein